MKVGEFKAWLEGFNEAIDGRPTKVQYQKILDKLIQVEETRIEIQYQNYTWPYWYQPYRPWWNIASYNLDTTKAGNTCFISSNKASTQFKQATDTMIESGSRDVWLELGKQEAFTS